MMIFTMVNDDGAPDVRLMPLSGSDLWEEDDGDDDVDDDDGDEDDDDDDGDDGGRWWLDDQRWKCNSIKQGL